MAVRSEQYTEGMDGELCTTCGLCCDGTLFAFARILPEEAEAARTSGLRLTERKGGLAFAQPCSRLSDRCCEIYSERPSVCRAYSCVVLRKLQGGIIERERADEIVKTAIALRDRLRLARSQSDTCLAGPDGETPAARLAAFALNHYLEQQFIRKKIADMTTLELRDGAANQDSDER